MRARRTVLGVCGFSSPRFEGMGIPPSSPPRFLRPGPRMLSRFFFSLSRFLSLSLYSTLRRAVVAIATPAGVGGAIPGVAGHKTSMHKVQSSRQGSEGLRQSVFSTTCARVDFSWVFGWRGDSGTWSGAVVREEGKRGWWLCSHLAELFWTPG